MRALLLALALVLPGSAEAAEPGRPFGSHPQPLAAGTLQPRGGQAALDPRGGGRLRRLVRAPDAPAHAVSEGQGYGMVIVALMAGHDPEARVRFDGLTRYLRGQLYETQPLDPATFAGMAGVLFIVGILAAYLPARRAASVSPMEAMRTE